MLKNLNTLIRTVPPYTIYIAGALPMVWLLVLVFTNELGPDPVKALEHQLGKFGLQLFLVGLAVTPLRKFTGLNLIKFRRAFGILAFLYVSVHLLVWLVLDIQLRWGEIWADIIKRPYITIGMVSFMLMLPLAVTSNNRAVKHMGAVGWRKLHKLTYPVTILAAVHYVLLVKGWQIEPLVYFSAILILQIVRIRVKWANKAA